MKKLIKTGLGLTFVSMFLSGAISHAGEGGVQGGGGDAACEMRIDEIRSDLVRWISSGGHKNLKLPAGVSSDEYASTMNQILAPRAVITGCITTQQEAATSDPELKVSVDGVPKACRGFISENDQARHMICNLDRFNSMKAPEQYRQIHHEYAGLTGVVEVNYGASSDYSVSEQITDYLEPVTVYKLAVKDVPQPLAEYFPNTPTDFEQLQNYNGGQLGYVLGSAMVLQLSPVLNLIPIVLNDSYHSLNFSSLNVWFAKKGSTDTSKNSELTEGLRFRSSGIKNDQRPNGLEINPATRETYAFDTSISLNHLTQDILSAAIHNDSNYLIIQPVVRSNDGSHKDLVSVAFGVSINTDGSIQTKADPLKLNQNFIEEGARVQAGVQINSLILLLMGAGGTIGNHRSTTDVGPKLIMNFDQYGKYGQLSASVTRSYGNLDGNPEGVVARIAYDLILPIGVTVGAEYNLRRGGDLTHPVGIGTAEVGAYVGGRY